jgi:hypothetical protein
MIVGHVQSGKTSNFIGLICKAADAGYRIIVVLAGMHENLRSQTQMRVDEGFLGYSAAEATTFSMGNKPVGVGKIVTDYRAPAHSLTGYGNKQDFNRAKASGLNVNPHGHDPIILVVKKNVTILLNLITWLASHSEIDPVNPKRRSPLPDVPLLVPEINSDHLAIIDAQRAARGWSGALVTNPNCSTVILSMALAPLRQFGLKTTMITTLQAISGAGYPGVDSWDILANVIPYIGGGEEE